MVIHTQAVALGIAVGEQAPLQHLVRREADAGRHIGGVEGGLLDLGKEVFRVAIQFHDADFDQRTVPVEPDLGQVEGVIGQFRGIGLRHDLDEQRPTGKVPVLDALKQVTLVALAVLADQGFAFRVGQVADALLRLEVKLDPVAFVVGVDEAEGVAAETVHVPVGRRDAAVAHDDGDLVQRFRQRAPEIPVVLRAAEVGARVALDGVVEVGELERIAHEEHRRVVADQVPVAFLGVELQREAANVALRIGRTALAGDGGEAGEHFGLLADLRKDLRPSVFRDVVGHGKGAVGAGALGVHAPLGDHLAVEVGELLQVPDILQQLRPARAGGHDVLVVGNWASGIGGQLLVFAHDDFPFGW